MSLIDTTDGVLMIGAYGWAFVKPIRKLYYNMTITFVSVLVALLIGGDRERGAVEVRGHIEPEVLDQLVQPIEVDIGADRGKIGGVALDVFENEPAVNPKLLKARNAVLLPHMGSATIEGRIDMGEKVIVNIKTFVDGHNPPDKVLATMF